jgi:hypothetical protein
MVQGHNRLIKKYNAIPIAIIGYLGVLAFILLMFLSYFCKGNSQIISIMGMVGLIVLIMFRNAKRFEFFGIKVVK